jgi:hypothetical protein
MPGKPKTEWREYFHRLKLEIDTLEKLEKTLEPEMFAKFVKDYAAHYVYSLNHRERPTRASDFLREFCEIEKLGVIPLDDSTAYRESRSYDVYQAPRENHQNGNGHSPRARPRRESIPAVRAKARKILGLDTTQAPAEAEEPGPAQSENLEPVAMMVASNPKPVQQALF